MKALSRGKLALLVQAGALALAAGQAEAQTPAKPPAKELTPIVFALPTNYSVAFAYFTAAMELGYYEQEGLKLTLQELAGGSVIIPQVSNKAILVGASGPDPLIIAYQGGKPRIPVKFFFNVTRAYSWEFIVPANSPIKTIADLKGKTLGVGALTNSHMPVTRVITKDYGLDPAKDYKTIAINVGAPAFKALLDGQVDVYNTFNTNTLSYEAASGTKLRRLDMPPRYKALFQNSFFAHDDSFKEKPEQLVGFGRATAKGMMVCEIATAWCIKNFWKYYPTLKPREGSEDENANKLVDNVREGWKAIWVFPEGKKRVWAEYPDGAWQNYLDILAESGDIPTNKVDPTAFYTNELVAKINDFDVAAVEKQAAGLK